MARRAVAKTREALGYIAKKVSEKGISAYERADLTLKFARVGMRGLGSGNYFKELYKTALDEVNAEFNLLKASADPKDLDKINKDHKETILDLQKTYREQIQDHLMMNP